MHFSEPPFQRRDHLGKVVTGSEPGWEGMKSLIRLVEEAITDWSGGVRSDGVDMSTPGIVAPKPMRPWMREGDIGDSTADEGEATRIAGMDTRGMEGLPWLAP